MLLEGWRVMLPTSSTVSVWGQHVSSRPASHSHWVVQSVVCSSVVVFVLCSRDYGPHSPPQPQLELQARTDAQIYAGWHWFILQKDKLVAHDHHKNVKFPEQTKQTQRYHLITQNQSETQFPPNFHIERWNCLVQIRLFLSRIPNQ